MSTASITSRAASVRSTGAPTHSGRASVSTTSAQSSHAKRHLPARPRQHDRPLALVEPGARRLEERHPHRLHHLPPRRRQPEHEERQRQRDERPGQPSSSMLPPDPAPRRRARRRAVERRGRPVRRLGERLARAARSSPPVLARNPLQASPVSRATSTRGNATSATRRSSVCSPASAAGSPASSPGASPRELRQRRAAPGRGAAVAHERPPARRERGHEQPGQHQPAPRLRRHRHRRRLDDVLQLVEEVDQALARAPGSSRASAAAARRTAEGAADRSARRR